MKKILALFLALLLCAFASCDNTDVESSSESSDSDTSTDSSEDISSSTSDDEDESTNESESSIIDTSIKVEYDADRENSDNEFPFDNIVMERNGYDIVSAGKYYGDDFDNVKYYGSYYRIIDNYDDFSELTQWGNKIDESTFDNNFVLVLHTYKNSFTYYSHPKFNDLNRKGRYCNFGKGSSGNLVISESKSCSGKTVVGEEPVSPEDYEVVFSADIKETIYLIIPKIELPENTPINGEIVLYMETIIDL